MTGIAASHWNPDVCHSKRTAPLEKHLAQEGEEDEEEEEGEGGGGRG